MEGEGESYGRAGSRRKDRLFDFTRLLGLNGVGASGGLTSISNTE